jgi:hypothetical protein
MATSSVGFNMPVMQPSTFRPAGTSYRMPEGFGNSSFSQGGTTSGWPAAMPQQSAYPAMPPMTNNIIGSANAWNHLNNFNAGPWQPELSAMSIPMNGFGFPPGLPGYPSGLPQNWTMQPPNPASARPAPPDIYPNMPRASYSPPLQTPSWPPSYPLTGMSGPAQNALAGGAFEAPGQNRPTAEQEPMASYGDSPAEAAVRADRPYIEKPQSAPVASQPHRPEARRKPGQAASISPASITMNAAPDDPAARIADEIRELVYEGLTNNPELLDEVQQMGISEKLQNREKTARQLRSTVQDVLSVVPDRFEDRAEQALRNRIPLEYQPLFDRFMNWTREPAAPGESTPNKPKSLLRRVWDWFWGRRDKHHHAEFSSEHRGLHLPFLKKHRHTMMESELDPFEITA